MMFLASTQSDLPNWIIGGVSAAVTIGTIIWKMSRMQTQTEDSLIHLKEGQEHSRAWQAEHEAHDTQRFEEMKQVIREHRLHEGRMN
jgi:type VI protein secretion system component VasK